MNLHGVDPLILAAAGAAAVILIGWLIYSLRRRDPSLDDLERRRRLHVNQVGRIAEGRVTELMKLDAPAPPKRRLFSKSNGSDAATLMRQMVCYSYSISGVTYETAQDVTGLEARVNFQRIVAGQPASIKYDPSNPSNSILAADDWSGLH